MINTSAQYQGDVRRYIERKVLRLAQRHLVLYQFCEKVPLPKGEGNTVTFTRFNRVPLPYGPLAESVTPVGQRMSISQVSAVVIQWGDKIILSDVAELFPAHPVMQQAMRVMGLQLAETQERNCFNGLNGVTQVNFVNSRGARASIVAGDVLDLTTINRTVTALETLGAPKRGGPQGEDVRKGVDDDYNKSRKGPGEHFVLLVHPVPQGDLRQQSTIQTAWSYSNIDALYINEVGQWTDMRVCKSNMVPNWVGVAAVGGTAGTAGSLPTGTYYIQVTGFDTQNQYETRIYQVSGPISVVGPNGSISVTLPTTAGFTNAVYIGTTSAPQNLGLSASGPNVGPYQGQAIQLAAGATVVITGTGLMQVPPAAPATGITVYPSYVFGEDAFGCVELQAQSVKWNVLTQADKSDPLNQQRVIGYKFWQGFVIKNQNFLARIESSASNTGTFG